MEVITPDHSHYDQLRHTYTAVGAPAFVLAAETTADVQQAIAFAVERELPLTVRSGGHGPSTSDGGVVLDLGALAGVEVFDARDGRVRVGAGARWGEVASALDPYDLGLTSGDHGDVGVGGLATVGGFGLLARLQGLTIDRVRAAELVLADGSPVRADRDEHSDLLWAIRGAGGAFGVVTALEFEAGTIGDVLHASFTYEATDLAGLIEQWAALVEVSPRELSSFLYVESGSAGALQARATIVHAAGDSEEARRGIEPFRALAPTTSASSSVVRYASLLAATRAPHTGQAAGMSARGGLLDTIHAEAAAELADLVTSGAAFVVQLRSLGGAVADVPAEATAFAHRTKTVAAVAGAMATARDALDSAWETGIGRRSPGAYLNFETVHDEATVSRVYPPETLDRLVALKRRYDPNEVFAHNLPLPAGAFSSG